MAVFVRCGCGQCKQFRQAHRRPFAPAAQGQTFRSNALYSHRLLVAVDADIRNLHGSECDAGVRQPLSIAGADPGADELDVAVAQREIQRVLPGRSVVQGQVEIAAVELERQPGFREAPDGAQVNLIQLETATAGPRGDGQVPLPLQAPAAFAAGLEAIGLARLGNGGQVGHCQLQTIEVAIVALGMLVVGDFDPLRA